jgi:hypothetical protein
MTFPGSRFIDPGNGMLAPSKCGKTYTFVKFLTTTLAIEMSPSQYHMQYEYGRWYITETFVNWPSSWTEPMTNEAFD